MKYLLALFFTSMSESQPVWYTNYSKASDVAIESSKLLLLNFSGSDWCKACNEWGKQIFVSDAFKRLSADRLVLINADFPRYGKNYLPQELRQQYDVLMHKYNPQKQFPYSVLIDTKGRKLKEWNLSQLFSKDNFMQELTSAVNRPN
jgi:thiol:disulfide interchange protein